MADASQTLLAHLVSQMNQNVDFLVSQQYLSLADGNAIRDKLHGAAATSRRTSAAPSPVQPIPRTITPTTSLRRTAVPPPPAPAPPPPQSTTQARALWDYNRDGTDAGDLSFSAGDIIEIVEESNEDWWVGRVKGKEALFPSAYVEKISAPAPPTYMQGQGEKKPYKPFGAAMHGVEAPRMPVQQMQNMQIQPQGQMQPYQGQQMQPYPQQGQQMQMQPQQPNSLGLTEDPATAEKKSKYGKYGNTFAHSAVGGVGLGAGSAIGGGLVRAIF